MAIFDPLQNPHPLTDHQKFGTSDYWLRPRPLRLCQIWCKSAYGGLSAFGANGWNIMDMFFINTFLRNRLQFRPVDGFSRLMAQTTRTRARVCLLWVSLMLFPIFRVKFPETPKFWGVNRRFQAKRAKYWKFHVIETTASISNKFLHNDRDHQVVTVGGPNRRQQIQDRGRPPFWKKNVKSPYLRNGLTDLYEIRYSGAKWCP